MTTGPAPLGHIGRYELIARLATGGMGEVFLARVRGAGGFEKEVVIKRILPHLASDPGFVQRFIEEGKLVVRLRHANIAQVLDMGVEAGVFFIAMEHVDGKDLAELLRLAKATDKPIPVPIAVFVLSELLEALDYAHRATDANGQPLGIIHRDVSPSNLLVSKTGEVKLVDFGIARATERLQASTTGVIRGKYGYMSPQQAAGAELDARSDLFSVGVVAWELLAGARPFDGASDLLTLDRVRHTDPGPLTAIAPRVPADLSAWVGRLLAKSPDDRFPSADDALEALRQHALETGEMARARDLAGWVDRVLAELPPALRGASTALSLDDVLRLGLGPAYAAPQTMDAAIVRTPSAPMSFAVAAPTPAAIGSAVSPLPIPAEPLAAVTPASPPAAPRRRPSYLPLLVVTNLLLIVVVLFLVLRPSASPSDADATSSASTGHDALTSAEVAAPTVVATVAPTTDAATSEAVAALDTTRDVASLPAPVTAVTAGGAFGGALASGAELALVDDVELSVRVTPSNATVTVAGIGMLPGSRKLAVRPGTTLKLRATAPDHHPTSRTIVVDDAEATVHLQLEPEARGIVKFRYLPANATVLLDGRPVATQGTNVLSLELTVGPHALEIVAGEYRTSRRFEIKPGETTNLGTLEL